MVAVLAGNTLKNVHEQKVATVRGQEIIKQFLSFHKAANSIDPVTGAPQATLSPEFRDIVGPALGFATSQALRG